MRDLTDPEVRKAIMAEAKADAKASIARRRRYRESKETVEIESKHGKNESELTKIWHKIGFFVPISLFFVGLLVLCLGWA